MSWDRIEGQWKQRRGKAVHHWGKMMNDELAAIAGRYEELVGKLQEKYGIAKEEAKEQVDIYKRIHQQVDGNAKGVEQTEEGGQETGKVKIAVEEKNTIQNKQIT